MKYGRLTVIDSAEPYISPRGEKSSQWLCKCDCGNDKIIRGCMLTSGNTKSCGCLRKEAMRDKQLIHGDTYSRLYSIWKNIKSRCGNQNIRSYERYGHRGIAVCKEWLNYIQFRDWALNNGYDDKLSIDRINNNDGYYPENCRWTDIITQSNNKRSNHILYLNGEHHTMHEWSIITGIPYCTLRSRINELKWSDEDALTIPVIDIRKRGNDGKYLPCDSIGGRGD